MALFLQGCCTHLLAQFHRRYTVHQQSSTPVIPLIHCHPVTSLTSKKQLLPVHNVSAIISGLHVINGTRASSNFYSFCSAILRQAFLARLKAGKYLQQTKKCSTVRFPSLVVPGYLIERSAIKPYRTAIVRKGSAVEHNKISSIEHNRTFDCRPVGNRTQSKSRDTVRTKSNRLRSNAFHFVRISSIDSIIDITAKRMSDFVRLPYQSFDSVPLDFDLDTPGAKRNVKLSNIFSVCNRNVLFSATR